MDASLGIGSVPSEELMSCCRTQRLQWSFVGLAGARANV